MPSIQREVLLVRITDFLVMNGDGDRIQADPHGNNVAFNCFDCEHPIVAVALENQRGSDEEHPAVCRGCGAEYFLDPRQGSSKMYIHLL